MTSKDIISKNLEWDSKYTIMLKLLNRKNISSSFVLHKSCFDLQHYLPPLPPPCWFASFGSVIVLFVPSFLPCLDTGHSIAYE